MKKQKIADKSLLQFYVKNLNKKFLKGGYNESFNRI